MTVYIVDMLMNSSQQVEIVSFDFKLDLVDMHNEPLQALSAKPNMHDVNIRLRRIIFLHYIK